METLEKNFYADRINEICKARKCNCKELAAECGIPYSTFQRYASGHSEPRAEAFAAFHQFGINLDWFVTGEGQMFRANRTEIRQEVVTYAKESNVVNSNVNNGTLVAEVGIQRYNTSTGGRGLRICQWVQDYVATHSSEDVGHLEERLRRAFPEFEGWDK